MTARLPIAERQQAFKEAVEGHQAWTENTKYSESFGVSNSAKIVEGGLFACNVNLNTDPSGYDQIVLSCLLAFPPEDKVYFSVFVGEEFPQLCQRLRDMLTLGGATDDSAEAEETAAEEGTDDSEEEVPAPSRDAIGYTSNNKNVKFYLADDGRLLMRNKGYWESLVFDRSTVEPAPAVDRIVFSVYPPAVSARRSLLAREFVGYLGNLVGEEKIHEIRVWPAETAVSDDMKRMPDTVGLEEIRARVRDLGGFYPGGEVESLHAALNFLPTKHFVILSGLSGTGKTQLALMYARAIHGLDSMSTDDPLLFPCPVRPEWTDPSGLTGYDDVLSDRYVVPPFLEALLVATAHRESPIFVLLDEMNLAPVEYYFSDVLSCIETGHPLQLHSHSVPREGTTGSNIRAELPLPHNVYLIGTINVDETTRPISDKVLDRASVIEMSTVKLEGFLGALSDREPELSAAIAACSPILLNVQASMHEYGLGFGYRAAEEFVRYHAFASGRLGRKSEDVMDEMLTQKILPKLRGSERQRRLLDSLKTCFADYPKAFDVVTYLERDLTEFGSFQAMR